MSYYGGYGNGGMYASQVGSHYGMNRGLGYPGYNSEYYNNGLMFPSANYHNRGWGAHDYAQRWLGNGYGDQYGSQFFQGAYRSPALMGGSHMALAPQVYQGYYNQLYGAGAMDRGLGSMIYGGGQMGHHNRMGHFSVEALAAAAGFQIAKMLLHRNQHMGLGNDYMGSREMLHGASMAEAVRLMNMGGLHGVDPRMLAQQAMFHANTIYSNPSMYMGGMGGGYGMGVGYGMGHAY